MIKNATRNELEYPVFSFEAPPGVSGNKGTWPKNYWKQGNKRKIKLGTS